MALAAHTLSPADAAMLSALADESDGDPGDPGFHDRAWPLADRLPGQLRRLLTDFRRAESAEACLVQGFPVAEETAGPTPRHWETAAGVTTTRRAEVLLSLCGAVLGDPFSWATLQSGRMVQNILPIPGDEKQQNGHGSEALLEFHTEDGFHPDRCDYLLLLGVRNHDRVPTLLSSVRDVVLDDRTRKVLAEPRFHILPDGEHLRQLAERAPDGPALTEARALYEQPPAVPVLFGDRLNPYLRIDRPFMRCAPGDTEAEEALDALMAELHRVRREVVVSTGSLLVLDNYLAVHGRKAFPARYDGTDRWLKKLTVRRDLRRLERARAAENRRVLY
ncbi:MULTISPECIES: guanitoxin biosynthesis L-enduracididine beta-hydroxylase GntD [unclassified Streptomyces]|uniref:guanitoxin biosynthesis L-enduracididine beta-hydroxylase GntD n=1 Tax=Streptomyces TaxID=1883 RepID=UPI00081E713B|nr:MULTISPECIES: guanitoxin biosynthesis L-enduracididine beta-hydroxylase GntD [unclassified Streptomyces]PVC79836.1 taurine catabolism dioxygenase TauD [Streptomyces sp. CS131]UCA51875.1 TauD/TfdA family dioxygenase [Streptomyces sp. WA6-1-16]SCF77742.1 arginine beta-hydroxylase, Fe(II)/alpha-ketoglutarate-dependent [Streptomyces sp. Cmuel-A718b]